MTVDDRLLLRRLLTTDDLIGSVFDSSVEAAQVGSDSWVLYVDPPETSGITLIPEKIFRKVRDAGFSQALVDIFRKAIAENCTMIRLDVRCGMDPDLPIVSAPPQD